MTHSFPTRLSSDLKITVFMSFILSEIPPGLRGFVTVGVIAAAAINSGLISMAAVAINDFYRPFIERKRPRDERHFILAGRSEEHTSELQSLMRISYAVFCLKKKKNLRCRSDDRMRHNCVTIFSYRNTYY